MGDHILDFINFLKWVSITNLQTSSKASITTRLRSRAFTTKTVSTTTVSTTTTETTAKPPMDSTTTTDSTTTGSIMIKSNRNRDSITMDSTTISKTSLTKTTRTTGTRAKARTECSKPSTESELWLTTTSSRTRTSFPERRLVMLSTPSSLLRSPKSSCHSASSGSPSRISLASTMPKRTLSKHSSPSAPSPKPSTPSPAKPPPTSPLTRLKPSNSQRTSPKSLQRRPSTKSVLEQLNTLFFFMLLIKISI